MICNLRFKKDVLIFKILLCFGYCAFCFEAISHPSCYLTSIVDKTHHGPVIAPFSLQLRSYISYVRSVLLTNPFFTVTDRYILTIQQTITHEEHL